MIKRIYTLSLFIIVFMLMLVLVGCGGYLENMPNESVSVEYEPVENELDYYVLVEIEPIPTNFNLSTLRANLLYARGESPAGHIQGGGGIELMWYHFIFDGWRLSGISTFFVYYVGVYEFDRWREVVSYYVQPNEWLIGSKFFFIDAFNLTPEDLISAQEQHLNRPMSEIHNLITRARIIRSAHGTFCMWAAVETGYAYIEGLGTVLLNEIDDAILWETLFCLNDIKALFSNDIYKIWAAFPGYGVVHNGRAYSPEWIMQNISQAINQEGIPLQEIERIFEMAAFHRSLDEIRTNAEATFRAEVAAMAN